LSPDISKVRVYCEITSGAFGDSGAVRVVAKPSGSSEVSAAGGRVVTTVDVLVPVPASTFVGPAIGQGASYQCTLSGYSTSQQRWDEFRTSSSNPAYRLSPEPRPISGTFTW
jgi:hypothetical protein